MSLLLDNIAAVLMSMVVIMMLASIQQRSNKQRVAKESRQTVVAQAQELEDWLRRDLSRIGDNMQPGENTPYTVAFENPEEVDGPPRRTEEFVFYRDSVRTSGNVTRVKIRYRLEDVGNKKVGGETQTIYQLHRDQKVGGGSWESTGESISALGGFKIDLLDADGQRLNNPKAAAQNSLKAVRTVRVRLFVVAPYQNALLGLRTAHVGSILVRYPMAEIRS